MWFQKDHIRGLEIPKERGSQRKYHTPTTEGSGNSEWEGGSQRPRKFQREGGCMFDLVSGGPLIQYGFECQCTVAVQKHFTK